MPGSAPAVTTLPLTPLDWALLAVLALSVLVGLVRGFVFEILALAGWVVAWFGAQWGAPWVRASWPGAPASSAFHDGLSFVLAFVGVLVAWALFARLVRLAIRATPLSWPDRLLGGGFGALRGLVLLLVLATAVAFTPLARSPWWQASPTAQVLARALQALKPWLPPAAGTPVIGRSPVPSPLLR